MSRTYNETAALVIYCKNKQKVKINNPSIRMIINMRQRCNDKPFKLTNWKFFVFMAILIFVLEILLIMFGEK